MTPAELTQYVDSWPWRHKYTEAYFHRISEGSIRSAKEVYAALEDIGVKYGRDTTVIDIGCGVGEWNNGNENYFGVDYKIPVKSLIIPKERYIELNLEKPETFKDVFDKSKFDLCLCLEVAEHISLERADALIELLCQLSDTVLFSAAIPYQGGTGHVNEQWQSYWSKKFENNNFYAPVNQPEIRSNINIELWYRQNIILFKKFNNVTEDFIINHNYLNFVLPAYYEEIVKNLKNQIK